MKGPYRDPWRAGQVLDGVERWAFGWTLLREIKIESLSRLDGLLLPTSKESPMMKRTDRYFWDRAGIVGVEVKVDRSDFLDSLKNGQLDRYDAQLSGMYLATPRGVCKTSEVPPNIGHLVVAFKKDLEPVAICRRNPKFHDCDFDPQVFWRVLFRLMKEMRDRENKRKQWYRDKMEMVGKIASSKVFNVIRRIEKSVEVGYER